MKNLLLALLVGALPLCAVDVTGRWSGNFEMTREGEKRTPPVYMVLKQDGNTVSGSGGPNAEEQHPFSNGKLEGDRLIFEVVDGGTTFKFDVKVLQDDEIAGDAARGRRRRHREC